MVGGKGQNGDTVTTPINGIVAGVRANLFYPKTPLEKAMIQLYLTDKKATDRAKRAKRVKGTNAYNGMSVKSATNANTQFGIADKTGAPSLTNGRLQGKDEKEAQARKRTRQEARAFLENKKIAYQRVAYQQNVHQDDVGQNYVLYNTVAEQMKANAKEERQPGLNEFPVRVDATQKEKQARWPQFNQDAQVLYVGEQMRTIQDAEAKHGLKFTPEKVNEDVNQARSGQGVSAKEYREHIKKKILALRNELRKAVLDKVPDLVEVMEGSNLGRMGHVANPGIPTIPHTETALEMYNRLTGRKKNAETIQMTDKAVRKALGKDVWMLDYVNRSHRDMHQRRQRVTPKTEAENLQDMVIPMYLMQQQREHVA